MMEEPREPREPREPPTFDKAVQSFHSWVETVPTAEVIDPATGNSRPFVTADDMKKYFVENNYRRLRQLIAVHAFPSQDVFKDDIVPNYTAVFCTLLSISKGWYIQYFRHHTSLSDNALPFDPKSRPSNWPQEKDADFLDEFCDAQWKFCAPVLSTPFVGKKFAPNMVLPIVSKENLNTEGSSASLWRIEIHPSYNNLIAKSDKTKLGPLANTFVMKTYFTSEAERYYTTEVTAYRHLGNHPNPSIIKFHGSFSREESYNIILEYADKGTLADYFKTESPPSEGEKIIRFWEVMFKLLSALRDIHQVSADGTDEPHVFQGRHKDVKPENILVVSNGSEDPDDWSFKLADLGISSFKSPKSARRDSAENYIVGTRTYGAPESYRPDGMYMHDILREGRNSDIWSLGCIYSEAVCWLNDGHRGVVAYRRERQRETANIQGFRDSDCFHDGEKLLDCVRHCHKNSVRNLRAQDFITGSVVPLIGDMLGRAEARSPAHMLYERSKQLIIDAKAELEAARPEAESSMPKFHGRPRKRSFTTPDHASRPQDPPVMPPGFHPSIMAIQKNYQNSIFASQNSSSRDDPPIHIPSQFGSTSEPEGYDNSRLSPTDLAHSLGNWRLQGPQGSHNTTRDQSNEASPSDMGKGKYPENWAELCQTTNRNRSPKHEAAIPNHTPSNSENSLPPLIASESRYELPSPPGSQPPPRHNPHLSPLPEIRPPTDLRLLVTVRAQSSLVRSHRSYNGRQEGKTHRIFPSKPL